MLVVPGDQSITKLFGFPGFEALIRVMVSHINKSKDEHAKPHVTYEEFRTEIETEMDSISNSTPE
ncbi:unnamed protein product [marine sediment metagenome]|uniref:Uncharacterized protein n=1 Tax=marine sediment metagenome TaxID=412755 RepID=X1N001_9ZZZZ